MSTTRVIHHMAATHWLSTVYCLRAASQWACSVRSSINWWKGTRHNNNAKSIGQPSRKEESVNE